MLHIDSLLLKAFYKENKEFLLGAKVQKIQQPTRREIVIHLRKMSESRKLYININPNFYHICFMNKQNELRRNIEIPKQPPMFCMLLRKHMEGARIIDVNAPDFERIFELNFENYNEIGDRVEECLSIELMGKHSNVVLYNTDNNIIIGCAHNIGEEKSKERELAGGLPYIYPPKQDKKNILHTRYDWFLSALKKSNDTLKKTISSKYFSMSQALVEDFCFVSKIDANMLACDISDYDSKVLFVAIHEFLEKENKKYWVNIDYSKYSCLREFDKVYESINLLIDDYFSFNIEKQLINSLKLSLQAKVHKELKRLSNNLSNQQKQFDKSNKIQEYKQKGNLLMANAYAIKDNPSKVILFDYEIEKDVEIDLDVTLTVIENAQRYFNLYNKNKKAYQIAEEMSVNTKSEIDYYKQLLYEIEETSEYLELKELAKDINLEDDIVASKNNVKFDFKMNILKLEIDGFTVFVGKNNKQNDYLYSKVSSPDDVWFHTLNTPGSHIIVKSSGNKKIMSDDTILKIAKLAKQYSTAKSSTKIAVVYTLRKYIKRPNNTKSGFVVYKNETEIVVD